MRLPAKLGIVVVFFFALLLAGGTAMGSVELSILLMLFVATCTIVVRRDGRQKAPATTR